MLATIEQFARPDGEVGTVRDDGEHYRRDRRKHPPFRPIGATKINFSYWCFASACRWKGARMNRRGFLTGVLGVAGLAVTGTDQPRAAAELAGGASAPAIRVRVPDFRPSVNALHFANVFPHAP